MFDKLIESEPEGADFKNRRGFFMASTLVVGILFLTAVVISIYAQDFALGRESLEIEALLAPAETLPDEPQPAKPRASLPDTHDHSDVPQRTENQSRTDEPTEVPISTSSVQNSVISRPVGRFDIGLRNTNPVGYSSRTDTATGPGESGFGPKVAADTSEPIKDPPPLIKDIPRPVRPTVQSGGVMNGKATYLPKPAYSAAALAVRADGKVDVQIMIDEEGKVVSAKAVSGHPLLRSSAEQAARAAKFTPTFLSKVAVKVTGVIVYNFNRN